MAAFDTVIAKFRELFNIAADVKDKEINKYLQEADKLDIKENLCGRTFSSVPVEFGGGLGTLATPEQMDDDIDYSIIIEVDGKPYNIVPLYTILCYYAFSRYLKNSDQASTSTGFKMQTYGDSIIIPDTSKNKRWEEERAKADSFIEDFRTVLELANKPANKCCETQKNYRVCFIK